MRLALSLFGNALILLGCGGLLLLYQGAFPEPVRNLLIGGPGARAVVAPGMPSRPSAGALAGQTLAHSPQQEILAPDSAAILPEAAPGDEPPAEAAPTGGDEDALTSGSPDEAIPSPTPEATPTPARTPTRTPTPAPTVRPVSLAGEAQTPITALRVPSIRLEADVVPARLITLGGVTTWEVPAFRVGHGRFTAGAGEPGNAVLIGHVSSVSQGTVFRNLDRVRVGDSVQILSGEKSFTYLVTETRRVPRTDLSLLAPTDDATITLLTCTGQWLEDVADYAERFLVRAVFEPPPTPTPTATPSSTATRAPTRTPLPTATHTATPPPTATPSPSRTPTSTPGATPPPPPPPTHTPLASPPTATRASTPSTPSTAGPSATPTRS